MERDTKILIIVPRYALTNEINYKYYFPLGLGYISSVLKNAGYDVDCLNLNHHAGYIKDIIDGRLDEKNYDYVCTGGNSLLYAVIEKILNTVNEHKSKPRTIIGGPILTSEPELIFNALRPDFGVIGEGEETVVELLKYLVQDRDLGEVRGIIFRDKGGKPVLTPMRESIKDLDSIPFPDFEGIGLAEKVEHEHCNDYYHNNYLDYPRSHIILTSRGCPFKCTFCYHFERYRERSIDNVMEELRHVVNRYKINNIIVNDECFGMKKEKLFEFCEKMKEWKNEISRELKWMCQMTVNSVDEERLKALKEAGCEAVSYGFESYSPVVLKSMQKPITPERISRAYNETIGAGMTVQAWFIFGDIAETKETAYTTLDYWKNNLAGQVGLNFIQPYPGSEIYGHCVRKGIIKDKIDFIKNKIAPDLYLNMTDNMSDKEFKQLIVDVFDAISVYRRHVKPLSLKRTSKDTYTVEVECPYCEKEITYKNCYAANRLTYGFYMICRNCHRRFFIVSLIRKIAYDHYYISKSVRDLYLIVTDYFKKKRL